jgi:hypothetical protein
MEARDELLTIAEISIGIAGFSGVIAAFLQRGGLHPLDRIRFVMLFAMAFTTLVLAYTPIVVSHLVDGTSLIWAYSSATMIGVWFASVLSGFLFLIPELRRDPSNNGRIPMVLLAVPSILNLAVQCLNASGWLWVPGFVAYLFGLFVYLYASGLMFVFVIMFRPSEPVAQQDTKPDVE